VKDIEIQSKAWFSNKKKNEHEFQAGQKSTDFKQVFPDLKITLTESATYNVRKNLRSALVIDISPSIVVRNRLQSSIHLEMRKRMGDCHAGQTYKIAGNNDCFEIYSKSSTEFQFTLEMDSFKSETRVIENRSFHKRPYHLHIKMYPREGNSAEYFTLKCQVYREQNTHYL
jgi:hypothetical protein